MNSIHNSERGASMLYVLAALLFVGFISASMLKLSAGDSVSSVFYKTSASARSAAKSGMISAIHFFENGGDSVRVLLQEWVDKESTPTDSAFTWIRGGDNTYVDMDGNKISDPAGLQAYKVKLLAFDTTTFNITLKATGVGKGQSRAEITTVHNLAGLGFGTKHEWAKENAIYLEDGVELQFRAPIEVTGDVRLSNKTDFDGWTGGSVFNGKFRSENGGTSDEMNFEGGYTFNGNCYFGTKPFWQRYALKVNHDESLSIYNRGFADFNGKVGFPAGAKLTQGVNGDIDKSISFDFGYTSFWLDEFVTKDGRHNSAYIVPNSTDFIRKENWDFFNKVTFKDENGANLSSYGNLQHDNTLDEAAILKELGMRDIPCEIKVNPNVIPADKIHDYSGDKNFTDIRDLTFAEWNGFLVLRVKGATTKLNINANVGDVLKRKVIVLVTDGGTLQATSGGRVFDIYIDRDATTGKIIPETSGNFTVIAMNGGKVKEWGGWSEYRGLLYCMNNGTITIGGSENFGADNLHGAIYATSGASKVEWYPLSGEYKVPGQVAYGLKPVIGQLIYDPTVYEELDVNGQDDGHGNTNFLTKDKCTDNLPISTGDLTINGSIEASMVSQHF